MSEIQKSPQEEQIASLFEECLEKNHGLGGHGTPTREVAESILQQGIRCNPSYGVWEMVASLPTEPSAAAQMLCKWPHKNHRFVVIVSIPEHFRQKQILEEVYDTQKRNSRSMIPARFIKGFFDIEKEEFVSNPLYESNPAPTATIEELIARQERIVNRVNSTLEGEDMTPPPIPAPSEASSITEEDIW